jgi:hypothetical protein
MKFCSESDIATLIRDAMERVFVGLSEEEEIDEVLRHEEGLKVESVGQFESFEGTRTHGINIQMSDGTCSQVIVNRLK